MAGNRKARIAALEQRIAALEALLDRDWSRLPPPYDIPLADLPTLPDYIGWSGYEDEWKPSGYV
jgi:hypothetical protein